MSDVTFGGRDRPKSAVGALTPDGDQPGCYVDERAPVPGIYVSDQTFSSWQRQS